MTPPSTPAAPASASPAPAQTAITATGDDQHRPLTAADGRRLLVLGTLAFFTWWLLNTLGTTFLLFGASILLAMVLNPLVVMLEKRGVRRGVGVLLLVVVALGLLGLAGWLVVPKLLDEIQELTDRAPKAAVTLRERGEELAKRYPALADALPSAEELAKSVPARAGGLAQVLLRSTFGLFGAIAAVVLAAVITAFILVDPKPLIAGYLQLWPDKHREAARRALARLMRQMTAWIRGVCINGLITGTSTAILLSLIGVKPALLFGFFAFLGEFVPYIGPVASSLPALFVSAGQGGTTFGLTLAAILFVQQVETTLLVPLIMGKELDLHPVELFFWTLAASALFGIVGAFLAVPVAAFGRILIEEFYLRPRRLDTAAIGEAAGRLALGETNVAK